MSPSTSGKVDAVISTTSVSSEDIEVGMVDTLDLLTEESFCTEFDAVDPFEFLLSHDETGDSLGIVVLLWTILGAEFLITGVTLFGLT